MKSIVKFARGECGYNENRLIGIKGKIRSWRSSAAHGRSCRRCPWRPWPRP